MHANIVKLGNDQGKNQNVMWFCTMKSKIAYNEMKRTVWIDYDDVYQMMAYPYMIRCIWQQS